MANPATQANPATGDAATFRPQQKQQQGGVQQEQAGYWGNTLRGQNPYHSNNSGNKQNSGPRWNNSHNKTFCIFCKVIGHTQQECWKRIRENKPCIDMNGHPFWPRGNFNNRPAIHNRGSNTSRNAVLAVTDEFQNPAPQEQDVAAFKPRQRQQPRQQNYNKGDCNNRSRGQNYRGNSNNRQNYNQNYSQPKNNFSRNGKYCVYCKMMNHAQEECRKRINDKQPCVNNKGQMYWPKINNTTESPNTVQQNSNPIVESIFEPTVFH